MDIEKKINQIINETIKFILDVENLPHQAKFKNKDIEVKLYLLADMTIALDEAKINNKKYYYELLDDLKIRLWKRIKSERTEF